MKALAVICSPFPISIGPVFLLVSLLYTFQKKKKKMFLLLIETHLLCSVSVFSQVWALPL